MLQSDLCDFTVMRKLELEIVKLTIAVADTNN